MSSLEDSTANFCRMDGRRTSQGRQLGPATGRLARSPGGAWARVSGYGLYFCNDRCKSAAGCTLEFYQCPNYDCSMMMDWCCSACVTLSGKKCRGVPSAVAHTIKRTGPADGTCPAHGHAYRNSGQGPHPDMLTCPKCATEWCPACTEI